MKSQKNYRNEIKLAYADQMLVFIKTFKKELEKAHLTCEGIPKSLSLDEHTKLVSNFLNKSCKKLYIQAVLLEPESLLWMQKEVKKGKEARR